MSHKELERLPILRNVEQKQMTLQEASAIMGVSYRQARRIRKKYLEKGPLGLSHGSRDRQGNRRHPDSFKKAVLDLFQAEFSDYGPTLASEIMEEEHGIQVHPETLRRWIHGACLFHPKSRPRQHRKRRRRKERFGQILQIDGSHHGWFEDRGDSCCLMVAVDDATGRTLCHMSPEETTHSVYTLLEKWIMQYGVPEAIYVDRRNIYVADREPTQEEQESGTGALTDFGRACHRLDIRIILAGSPEAKGRVERMNGTLQDRLVKHLRRRNIGDIAKANAEMDAFTEKLNEKFSVEPASPVDSHRKRPKKALLRDFLTLEEHRVVARDWTIRWHGAILQIPKQDGQPSPKDKVVVRERLDGSRGVYFKERELRTLHIATNTTKAVIPPPSGGGTHPHKRGHF